MAKTKRPSVVEEMTAAVIEMMEEGDLPPWSSGRLTRGLPQSNYLGVPYRGVNAVWTAVRASALGYESNVWITRNHMKKLGSFMRKGERGTRVAFYRSFYVDKTTGKRVSRQKANEVGKENLRTRFSFGYNWVWNLDQVGEERTREAEVERIPDGRARIVAEKYLAAGPKLLHSPAVEAPAYNAGLDLIKMPPAETMEGDDRYFSSLYHEIGHSTGHASRLNRSEWDGFGTHDYAVEELVAELFACSMCGLLDLTPPALQRNHAAYIAGWLRLLEDEPDILGKAATAAQEALDFTLKAAGMTLADFGGMSDADAETLKPLREDDGSTD